MLTLITGGSASGKSAYAEELVSGDGAPVYYIAAMEPYGKEAGERIEKHRARRAGRNFITVERPRDIGEAEVPEGCRALLEDLGNLTANELFCGSREPDGEETVRRIMKGINDLNGKCGDLTIVTNEVFSGGTGYGEGTLLYMKTLAEINRAVAGIAGSVIEVVCGIPDVLKEDGIEVH